MKIKPCLVVLAGLFAQLVHAEVYRGISSLDTLADVKWKFPNARYEALKPAWAQPQDALFEVSGPGISGSIVVKFYDTRPFFKKRLEGEVTPEQKQIFESLVNRTQEEALTVEWVRWVPEEPIPIQRLISKYGKPEISGFTDEDFRPFRRWMAKGLLALLSNDEKAAVMIDFRFTVEEQRLDYKNRYGFVPDHLK